MEAYRKRPLRRVCLMALALAALFLLSFVWGRYDVPLGEVVRILLSTFCAGTLGFERERHNQAAGFRTYIIVSDASALVMMTNIFVAGIGETDLVRMSASVITGLGFLGAGTILVTRNQEVRGLTTAAGLWAVAIIGTAFGAGFYAGGIICYAFIFLAMQVLRRVDLRIRKTQRVSTVYFEMERKSMAGQIIRHVKSRGHYIWDLNLFSETQEKSGGPVCGTFTLWVNGKTTLDEMLEIFKMQCRKSQYTLSPDAEQDVKDFIYDENADGVTFGNARGVRNLFEQILTAQANRLAKMESFTKDDLMTLTRDDVLHARGMEDDTTVAELEAKTAESKEKSPDTEASEGEKK